MNKKLKGKHGDTSTIIGNLFAQDLVFFAMLNKVVKKAERELKKPLIIKMKEEHQIDINFDDDFFDI